VILATAFACCSNHSSCSLSESVCNFASASSNACRSASSLYYAWQRAHFRRTSTSRACARVHAYTPGVRASPPHLCHEEVTNLHPIAGLCHICRRYTAGGHTMVGMGYTLPPPIIEESLHVLYIYIGVCIYIRLVNST